MTDIDDSYIECAHCGERFFYDLITCPNCGISVYPDEGDQREHTNEETIYGEVMGGILAVAVGWFVTGVVGVLIYIATVWIFNERAYMMPTQLLLYSSVPVGAFFGGYITVSMTKRAPILFGTIVGVMSLTFAILLVSYERDLASEPLLTAEMILWWAVIILGGVGGALSNALLSKKAAIDQLFSLPDNEDKLYQELYGKVGYNHARVERLIELEREQFPDASRYYLLKSAIRSWERDNR
jgi:hypothetical protein